MAGTKENLEAAFAGESQAFQKYTNYAAKADKDGFPNVARLFRTAAQAERIHAGGHFAALDGIGSTAENLRQPLAGKRTNTLRCTPRCSSRPKPTATLRRACSRWL